MNVGDHAISVRTKAICMLEAVHNRKIAHKVGAGLSSIKRCWAAAKRASIETKARSGRPKILNRAAKIVILKSFLDNLVSSMPIELGKY